MLISLPSPSSQARAYRVKPRRAFHSISFQIELELLGMSELPLLCSHIVEISVVVVPLV